MIAALLAVAVTAGVVEVEHPAMLALVDEDAALIPIATGFKWAEGPVWVRSGGFLLWSDVHGDAIHRYKPGEGVSVFLPPRVDGRRIEPNGMKLDQAGRVVVCQHGTRSVARLRSLARPEAGFVPLATAFRGRRFSSPNDLVFHRSGSFFFTDPPFGLPGGDEDPSKELPMNGVFRVDPDGRVSLVAASLERPNGIALSPDQKTLYVASAHRPRPVWLAYDVTSRLALAKERVFFDASALVRERGLPPGNDGLAVDVRGNLFATGPGGVLVLSPEGRHLGTIRLPNKASNCAFGEDGQTLFITSVADVFAIRMRTRGLGFEGWVSR